MGGRHYNHRMSLPLVSGFPTTTTVAAAQNALARRTAILALPCTCEHPPDEHEDEEGCLHGWGEPPATGCMCMGTP